MGTRQRRHAGRTGSSPGAGGGSGTPGQWPGRALRSTRDAAAATGHRLRRATDGDRPYAFAVLGLVALLIAMALGPLQSLSAAQGRVEDLQRTSEELQVQVDALEDRREVLQDPEALELMAREELGMVKPGEIPFVVVTPEDELGLLGPDQPETSAARSLWDWLRRTVADFLR